MKDKEFFFIFIGKKLMTALLIICNFNICHNKLNEAQYASFPNIAQISVK